MKTPLSLLATFLIVGCATSARTGPTLGEYLDKGARKLNKVEYTAVMSGRVVTGQTPSGRATMNLTFDANGTMSGTVTANSGAVTKSVGTWTVDDNGKYCINEHLVDWNMRHSECSYMFVLGTEAIIADSDTDRSARTTVRAIKNTP